MAGGLLGGLAASSAAGSLLIITNKVLKMSASQDYRDVVDRLDKLPTLSLGGHGLARPAQRALDFLVKLDEEKARECLPPGHAYEQALSVPRSHMRSKFHKIQSPSGYVTKIARDHADRRWEGRRAFVSPAQAGQRAREAVVERGEPWQHRLHHTKL